MTRKTHLLVSAFAGLAIAGCDPATRSITPASLHTDAAPLYRIEREIRDGAFTASPRAVAEPLGGRVALVIGNSAYANVPPLDNPRSDAVAMAALLEKNGFQVIQGFDVTKRSFEGLLRDAAVLGGPGAEIVVFYAGHGLQIGTRNYLLPVDANLSTPDELPFQTVRLNSLLDVLDNRSAAHLSFLDSCRNNPFVGKQAKTGITRGSSPTLEGFAEPTVPAGALVAYSTEPGALALDGEGSPNSPYTAALLQSARSNPNQRVESLLRQVRGAVRRSTRGVQTPTWTSRLEDRFSLKPANQDVAKISPAEAACPDATVVAAAIAANSTPPDCAVAPVADAPVPALKPEVSITAPLEKAVAIGGRIAAELRLPPEAKIAVSKAPEAGDIALVTTDGRLDGDTSKDVTGASIGSLVYMLPPKQRPAQGRINQSVHKERIRVDVELPGQAAQSTVFDISLVPDACDFEAGEWFDLQGVGVYREPGDVSASRALKACSDALRKDPSNARFHFLYGKALEQSGRLQEAMNAYQTAASLEHIRAWHALGQLSLRMGLPDSVAMQHFRRGVSSGDPLAIQAAGVLALENAVTEAEREEAYELLGYAIDFGLTGAMRALAEYFNDPMSPDHDPVRAKVFEREADARETRSIEIEEFDSGEDRGGGGDPAGPNDPS